MAKKCKIFLYPISFKERTLNPVFSDYGDYSSYRSNFAKVEDRNLGNL